jgi:hypothetical protein
MSDDYGQFVPLDIDNQLEPIETFKLKYSPIYKENKQRVTNTITNTNKDVEQLNYNYWCILGLCIIMLI